MASQVRRQSEDAFFREPRQFGKRSPTGWPIGPRTERRAKENRQLNKLPDSVKRVCEVRIEGVCVGNKYLTWSHALKSRFLVTSADWQRAARSCQPCHLHCEEKMSHKERSALIDAVIERRK